MYRVAVLTFSDSSFRGERKDISGNVIVDIMNDAGYRVVLKEILPDDQSMIEEKLKEICDSYAADLILTTGGTGFSPRDCAPEATSNVTERAVPGIPEAIRNFSLKITPRAMLSRAGAGIRKNTLIVNLPGGPKAVDECLNYILGSLGHGLDILTENDSNCART